MLAPGSHKRDSGGTVLPEWGIGSTRVAAELRMAGKPGGNQARCQVAWL